jgi:Lon protease-like protein
MSEDPMALPSFAGTARLFPLPNLVMFPQVVQPLHIFEPRYRQMTTDALDGDRLIAVVLLRPGWEANYAGQPDLHRVACLGRIVVQQRLDDGRFNILLRGLDRIRLLEEVNTGKLYRSARAEILQDTHLPPADVDRKLRRHLARRVPAWFEGQNTVLTQFRKLLKSNQPLGVLCDILAFALPLDAEKKQELLELQNVELRTRQLLHEMDTSKPIIDPDADKRKFPPEFSQN